jgi:hypothetical protein
MTRSVTWRCPCDGRQHLATLTGNPLDGYQVRAFCGRTTDQVHLPDLLPEGEVTCPACRTEEEIAALVKYLAA